MRTEPTAACVTHLHHAQGVSDRLKHPQAVRQHNGCLCSVKVSPAAIPII
jgi:hypothetical protein